MWHFQNSTANNFVILWNCKNAKTKITTKKTLHNTFFLKMKKWKMEKKKKKRKYGSSQNLSFLVGFSDYLNQSPAVKDQEMSSAGAGGYDTDNAALKVSNSCWFFLTCSKLRADCSRVLLTGCWETRTISNRCQRFWHCYPREEWYDQRRRCWTL